VIKAEFTASLLQSSVSHDPTEIIIIWCSRNIYDYYPCWKQFFTFLFQDSLMNRKLKNRIDLKWKAFVTLITTIQKFGVSKNLFFYFWGYHSKVWGQ